MILEFHELEYHKNFSRKFEVYFFKELEFLELEFQKGGRSLHIFKIVVDYLEFQKGGRSLHISKTVVDC